MEFDSVFRSALKCPMAKTKNVRRAERAGDENAENSIATPVRIISST